MAIELIVSICIVYAVAGIWSHQVLVPSLIWFWCFQETGRISFRNLTASLLSDISYVFSAAYVCLFLCHIQYKTRLYWP
jgi:hypothetical protein